MTTLPVSNVTFRQVKKLRRNYEALCAKGEPIIIAFEQDGSRENLDALMAHRHALDLAYKLWDQAHRECYGF